MGGADVQPLVAEDPRKRRQQARTVGPRNLDHRGRLAGVVIDHDHGPDLEGGLSGVAGGGGRLADAALAARGLLQGVHQGLEPARFGLAVRQARPVLNPEDVQDHALAGGRHPGVGDVGAQGGHGLGQVGEQAGPVGGGDGDLGGLDRQALDRGQGRGLGGGAGLAGPLHQGRMRRQRILARHVLAPEQGGDLVIEGAHQLPLPAVPDARPHGADVGHGQDQQHAQPLGVADQFGEGADRGRIGQVALLGVVGQGQMAAHQPDHQFDPARIDTQAFAGAARGDGPVLQLAPLAALADVVQQHAQHQGLHVRDQMHDLGRHRMVGLQLAAGDVVDDADGLQRVLVHRIGVVHVELGLADDPPPFGQEPAQEARLVHDGQGAIRPLAVRQDVQEGARRLRITTQPGRHQRQAPADGREGVGVQIQVVAVGADEQGQKLDRIGGEDLGPLDRQTPLVDPEALDLQLAAVGPERGHQARQALGGLLVAGLQLGRHGAGQGADVAGDQEIAAHEPFHRRLVTAPAPPHPPGHLGLHVEGQLLLGPPRDQMQMDPHPPQKIEGLVRGAAFARGEHLVHHRRAQPAFRRQGAGDPVQGVQVAQPPLAVLDVGLDLVAGHARLLVAEGALLQFCGDEGAGVGLGHHVAETADHQVRKPGVPGQRPGLQQGGAHRHVGARQGQTVFDRPHRRPHLRPQIPQDIEDELDHPLAARRRLAGPQEQQVQVGIGR